MFGRIVYDIAGMVCVCRMGGVNVRGWLGRSLRKRGLGLDWVLADVIFDLERSS